MSEDADTELFAGQYRLLEVLSEGTSSSVYRAEDVNLGRDVALKILDLAPSRESLDDVSRLETWVRRFEREARLVSQLKDPNTVTIYDFGTHDDETWYTVFEYIDGRTLDELLDEEGAAAPDRAVRIVRQILQSLQEAHAHDVLHRDVKPSNIMVFERVGRPDGVKLLDFGIAKPTAVEADPDRSSDVTREEIILGTPRYMAPEQAKSDSLSAATDLYALGLVFWELLVGRSPIEHDDTIAMLSRQVSSEPFSLPDTLEISPRLRGIVETAVSKEPSARFQSTSEMLEALRKLDDGEDSAPGDELELADHEAAVVDPSAGTREDVSVPEAQPPDSAEHDGVPSGLDESSSGPILETDHWFGSEEERPEEPSPSPSRSSPVVDERKSGSSEAEPSGPSSGDDEVQGPGVALEPESDEETLALEEIDDSSESETTPGDSENADTPPPDAKRPRRQSRPRRANTAAAVLGTLIGGVGLLYLGYFLAGPTLVELLSDRETAAHVDAYVTTYVPYLGRGHTFAAVDASNASIFEAIELTEWKPKSESARVQTDGESRTVQNFEWDDATMTAEIYEHDSPVAARRRVEKVEPPARAIQIATKAVVLSTPDDDATVRLKPAREVLENYRSLFDRH